MEGKEYFEQLHTYVTDQPDATGGEARREPQNGDHGRRSKTWTGCYCLGFSAVIPSMKILFFLKIRKAIDASLCKQSKEHRRILNDRKIASPSHPYPTHTSYSQRWPLWAWSCPH